MKDTMGGVVEERKAIDPFLTGQTHNTKEEIINNRLIDVVTILA